MIETKALHNTLSFYSSQNNNNSKVSEFQISPSFSTLLYYSGVNFRCIPEMPAPRVGQKAFQYHTMPRAAHAFDFPETKTTHIIEFKVFSPKFSPKNQIADALEQCLQYKLIDPPENQSLFSAFIFKDDGSLLYATRPRSLEDATQLMNGIRADEITLQEEDDNCSPSLI